MLVVSGVYYPVSYSPSGSIDRQDLAGTYALRGVRAAILDGASGWGDVWPLPSSARYGSAQAVHVPHGRALREAARKAEAVGMIRAARADDFAHCAEIDDAVNPDSPATAEQLATAPGSSSFTTTATRTSLSRASRTPRSRWCVSDRSRAPRRRRLAARRGGREGAGARTHVDVGPHSRRRRGVDAFVAHRGFEEVNRDVDVLLDVAPGDGRWRPESSSCAPSTCAARTQSPPSAFRRWRCLGTPRCTVSTSGSRGGAEQPGRVRRARRRRGRRLCAALLGTGAPAPPQNGLTAVRHSHRRRGIATALKRAQISWAAANGFRELVTSSVEGNAAMRAVNERLGYRPLPAWIVVQGPAP